MPGRRTFTITSRPLASSAGWICAIDAVAIGSGSIRTNVSGGSSVSITCRISSHGTGRDLVHELAELLDVDVRQEIRA
jgi:hypothetical protein